MSIKDSKPYKDYTQAVESLKLLGYRFARVEVDNESDTLFVKPIFVKGTKQEKCIPFTITPANGPVAEQWLKMASSVI